jgi:hypothetical protein
MPSSVCGLKSSSATVAVERSDGGAGAWMTTQLPDALFTRFQRVDGGGELSVDRVNVADGARDQQPADGLRALGAI